MHNPDLYEKNNSYQKQDVKSCLKKHKDTSNFVKSAQIIDIGSGNGEVTRNILQKYLPHDFKSIIGIDISKEMVEHANKYYSDDKTTFITMDISGDLPETFVGNFNHAFSFYTLHWVHDQEKAFSNIYNLIADDGDCLLLFLAQSDLYDAFKSLSRMEKWKGWVRASLGCIDRFITRYHDMKDPAKELRRIMTESGFRNVSVETNESPHVFSGPQALKTFIQALNPFKIPEDLLEDFGQDAVQMYMETEGIRRDVEDNVIIINNTLFTAKGCK